MIVVGDNQTIQSMLVLVSNVISFVMFKAILPS